MSLKIEVDHQSERQILIQQDMAWWSARIVRVRDTSRVVQGANVAQSARALVSLKRSQKKIRIFNCHAYIFCLEFVPKILLGAYLFKINRQQ